MVTEDFLRLRGDGSLFREGDGGGRTLMLGGGMFSVTIGGGTGLLVDARPARLPRENRPAVKREEYAFEVDVEGAMVIRCRE